MRKALATALGFVLTMLLAAGSYAGQKQPRQGKGKRSRTVQRQRSGGAAAAQQQVRELVPKILAAWESFDINKVDPYYAKNADLPYFDITPLKYSNWAEYRAGVQKAFFEPNQSGKLKMNDDLQAHGTNHMVFATFTFGADFVSKEGKTSHLDGRWTMVLARRASGWIVVHEHVSAPLPGA